MAKGKSKVEVDTSIDPVTAALAAIEKQWGEGAVQIGRSTFLDVEVIRTGLLSLDCALGCGGLPRGRIAEVYGPESAGKTSLCLRFMAACQKAGGVGAFIDAEHALDPQWAGRLGVDMDKLMLSQPNSGEEGLGILETFVELGAADLVIVDSVAALTPKEELDGELTDIKVGAQARMMSKALRRLNSKCTHSKTVVIFINQLRDKIGGFNAGFAKPEVTPGGRALKFYASLRMEIRRGAALLHDKVGAGIETKVKIVKNKVAPPFRTAGLNLWWKECDGVGPGFDDIASLLAGSIERKIVTIRGSNYYYGEEKIGVGEKKALQTLQTNADLSKRISDATYESLAHCILHVAHENGVDDESGFVEAE